MIIKNKHCYRVTVEVIMHIGFEGDNTPIYKDIQKEVFQRLQCGAGSYNGFKIIEELHGEDVHF